MFLIKDISVKKTKNKGKGIFATKEILPGTIIGDYLGVITEWKNEKRMKDGIYNMYYSDSAMIQPNPRRNPGVHFINHSCEPNCGMTSIKRHTIYFALRRIFKGEELTVHYWLEPQFKDVKCNPCKDICHCGSLFCGGTMHLSEKEELIVLKYVDGLDKKVSGKPPVAYGKNLPMLANYPKVVKDNPVFRLFGCKSKKPQKYNNLSLPGISFLRKEVRRTGKFLFFPKIRLIIRGIVANYIIALPANFK